MAESIITAERLRALFKYDPEAGVFTRLTTCFRSKAGDHVGSVNQLGYLATRIDGRHYKVHRLAWLYVHGSMPTGVIDHINGDKLDNRIANLRDCTSGQNLQNQRRAQGSNGLLGAHWHKATGTWQSQIKVNKKQKHLGYFDTPEDAHAAYIDAKRRLHPFGQL